MKINALYESVTDSVKEMEAGAVPWVKPWNTPRSRDDRSVLCAHLDLKGELRHADYIANWIDLLKEDNRAIFTAASLAPKAADFLRAFSEPKEEVTTEAAAV
jgi:antirestriction protein ArdC